MGSRDFAGSDEPLVAVHLGHVVRGQEHGVVACCIEVSVGSVDYFCFGEHDAALGLEVVQDELMLDGLFWLCRVLCESRCGGGSEKHQ